MAQAKDRTRRIGSERHETISHVDYVTPGTLEEAVIAVLDGKYATLEEIVRIVPCSRKLSQESWSHDS